VDQETQWLQAVKQGSQPALAALLAQHEGLIWRVAHIFSGGDPELLEDMVQEARLAFIAAARLFQPAGDAAFSTYAWESMHRSCRRARERFSTPYSVSLKVFERKRRYRAAAEAMRLTLGREATREEIMPAANLTEKEVEEILTVPEQVLSIDFTYTDGGHFGECLAIDEGESVGTDDWLTRHWMEQELAALPQREAAVIKLHYGWDGPELGLTEVGQHLGINRQRSYQLREKGLRTLRERNRAPA
jgi:RNA polymerase primary sigma factor